MLALEGTSDAFFGIGQTELQKQGLIRQWEGQALADIGGCYYIRMKNALS